MDYSAEPAPPQTLANPVFPGDLMEKELPLGDVAGFDIAPSWVNIPYGSNRVRLDPQEWLGKGYKGVRFVGKGLGKTRLLPSVGGSTSWDYTLNIHPEAGHVVVEGVSLHTGPRGGAYLGRWKQTNPIPWLFEMRESEVIADRGPNGERAAWGLFSYQTDERLVDVDFHCAELTEHADYHHHFASAGMHWNRVNVHSSGAEGCKVRNDPSEGAAVLGATIFIQDSTFKEWYQPWSSRGGAGMVFQGTGADIILLRNEMYGREGKSFMHCLMIDDNGAGANSPGKGYYGAETGRFKEGSANGHVWIKDCGMTGVGPEWYEALCRVALDSADKVQVARSFWMEGSGLFGAGSLLSLGDMPNEKIHVKYCNTDQIKNTATARGIDPLVETSMSIPGISTVIPVSEGYN
jgi:hypothetical protein